jgi:Acetyltransferase (GNAT) family.
LTAEEVNVLRASIGFRQIHPEQIQESLIGSAFIVAAYKSDKIVGMARLIWDGGMCALLTDLIVIPEYRLHGIEAEMVSRVFTFLREKLKPGFGIQLDVRAWGDQTELFEGLGFQKSSTEHRGVPMHICLTDHIELTDAMFGQ